MQYRTYLFAVLISICGNIAVQCDGLLYHVFGYLFHEKDDDSFNIAYFYVNKVKNQQCFDGIWSDIQSEVNTANNAVNNTRATYNRLSLFERYFTFRGLHSQYFLADQEQKRRFYYNKQDGLLRIAAAKRFHISKPKP